VCTYDRETTHEHEDSREINDRWNLSVIQMRLYKRELVTVVDLEFSCDDAQRTGRAHESGSLVAATGAASAATAS
jgi:hypothetical protein